MSAKKGRSRKRAAKRSSRSRSRKGSIQRTLSNMSLSDMAKIGGGAAAALAAAAGARKFAERGSK